MFIHNTHEIKSWSVWSHHLNTIITNKSVSKYLTRLWPIRGGAWQGAGLASLSLPSCWQEAGSDDLLGDCYSQMNKDQMRVLELCTRHAVIYVYNSKHMKMYSNAPSPAERHDGRAQGDCNAATSAQVTCLYVSRGHQKVTHTPWQHESEMSHVANVHLTFYFFWLHCWRWT